MDSAAPDLPTRYADLHRRARAILRRESARRRRLHVRFYQEVGVGALGFCRICADPLHRGGNADHLATWAGVVARLEAMAATLPRRRARREVDEMAHARAEMAR